MANLKQQISVITLNVEYLTKQQQQHQVLDYKANSNKYPRI